MVPLILLSPDQYLRNITKTVGDTINLLTFLLLLPERLKYYSPELSKPIV